MFTFCKLLKTRVSVTSYLRMLKKGGPYFSLGLWDNFWWVPQRVSAPVDCATCIIGQGDTSVGETFYVSVRTGVGVPVEGPPPVTVTTGVSVVTLLPPGLANRTPDVGQCSWGSG